jgi:hypothetical protein
MVGEVDLADDISQEYCIYNRGGILPPSLKSGVLHYNGGILLPSSCITAKAYCVRCPNQPSSILEAYYLLHPKSSSEKMLALKPMGELTRTFGTCESTNQCWRHTEVAVRQITHDWRTDDAASAVPEAPRRYYSCLFIPHINRLSIM